MAYKVAASLSLKNAAKKCGPVLLEPIMAVEVTAPSEYLRLTPVGLEEDEKYNYDRPELWEYIQYLPCLLYTSRCV